MTATARAVLATWLANRTFTFPDKIEQSRVREASTYVAVQLVGGAANFAVYSALVHSVQLCSDWPILALAFGAAASCSSPTSAVARCAVMACRLNAG